MIDDELSPDLRDLFDAERRRDGPPAGAKERVHAALAASIGVGLTGAGAGKAALAAKGAAGATSAAAGGGAVAGGAVAGGAAGAASGAAVTATGGALAKGLAFALVAAMAGTAGTGVYLAQRDDDDRKPAAVVVDDPAAATASAFDPSVLGNKPEPVPEPQPRHVATRHTRPAPSEVGDGGDGTEGLTHAAAPAAVETPAEKAARLAGERTILDDARAAVGRGDGGAALIALEAHRRRYPNGALVEEREALTVMALAKLGRTAEAHKTADAFHERYPASLFLGAVDAALSR